ncbi:MAG: dihydrolipoyl dehydrogenase [Nitrospirae bacterium]|nr:MAG: dihydrolipoyl dehydrogenase [Nitrospirota bacterium]
MTKIAILGAGPGGYVAAIKAAQMGAEVTVVEDTEVGGTCLNRGCIPTKTLVATTEALIKMREGSTFGIDISGEIKPDINRVMERKDKVVSIQVKGIRALFKSWNIKLIEGRGRLRDNNKIEVELRSGGREEVIADKIIIATGSKPAKLPLFPFDGERILSSDDALQLKEIPERLLVVGAGVIGCEYAFIFNELGSSLTLVEMMPRALATVDEEISTIIQRELKKKKMKLHTNVSVEKVDKREDRILVTLSDGKEIETDKVLVSVGRELNSDGIGLEELGVKKGKRGEIIVNDKMETSVEGIYAVGDVIGGMMLAHVASKEGVVAVENAMGRESKMNYDVIPYGIFTIPEIGCVGLTEKEAIDKGFKVKVGRFQYRGLGKAHAMGEITGMVKIIAEDVSDKIIGAHIIGAHASDMIHELALAMEKGIKALDVAHMVHSHPTLAEAIMEAAEDVHGIAIHVPKLKK